MENWIRDPGRFIRRITLRASRKKYMFSIASSITYSEWTADFVVAFDFLQPTSMEAPESFKTCIRRKQNSRTLGEFLPNDWFGLDQC
jgi:hypothetical protein